MLAIRPGYQGLAFRVCCLAVLCFSAYCPCPAFAGSPSFMGLGQLSGGSSSLASAISADGTVIVGSALNAQGSFEAYRWTQSGGMVGLGYLQSGGFSSSAQAVNSDGSVIAGDSSDGFMSQAFRWTSKDGMSGIGFLPGGTQSSAHGISYDGSVIVGGTDSKAGPQAFRWTAKDGMTPLGYVDEAGTFSTATASSADGSLVVGAGNSADSKSEAFYWTEKTGVVSLGILKMGREEKEGTTYANAVSADGSVIAGGATDGKFNEAFRWTMDSGIVGLGMLPGGNFSDARGISADGSVLVGTATDEFNISQAMIWTETGGMRTLRDLLENDLGVDLTGWILESAQGISADGLTITGNGMNPDGQPEAWVAHIPEPSAVVLFVTAVVPTARRRRSR